ncbi:MAG: hypothetical protein J5764_01375, partial [Bacteroidales bacterium]|nr:hypothetical protein [Bacteroidales bacterium]
MKQLIIIAGLLFLGCVCASAQTDAAKYIEEFNSEVVHFVAKPKDKTAKILFCQCKLLPDSEVVDEMVELRFVSEPYRHQNMMNKSYVVFSPRNQKLKIYIRNKTNKLLYVDLGNSFFLRGSGSEVMYVPAATSSGTSSASGASVNLGSVNRSAGLGGVTVGSTSVNTTTTTVYSQRIVSIPPRSEIEAGSFQLFPEDKEAQFPGSVSIIRGQVHLNLMKPDQPTIGEERMIADENFVRFGAFLTYATDESQTEQRSVSAFFCLDRIVGGINDGNMMALPIGDFTPNYPKTVYFVAWV